MEMREREDNPNLKDLVGWFPALRLDWLMTNSVVVKLP